MPPYTPAAPASVIFVIGLCVVTQLAGCFVEIGDLVTPSVDGGAGDASAARDAASGAYREAVLADAPIAYWRFGEAGGTVARDESPLQNHARYSGNCALGKPGALAADTDTAVGFDGTTAGVSGLGSAFDFSGRKPFSIEGWVRPRVIEGGLRYFFAREWQTPTGRHNIGMTLQPQSGLGFERHVDDVPVRVSSAAPAIGVFVHVVGTYDGSTLLLYQDGVLSSRADDGREAAAHDALFFMGGKDFDGDLDEVAIYDKALGPERVKAHHDIGIGR